MTKLQGQVSNLQEDNQRLRRALVEAELRSQRDSG